MMDPPAPTALRAQRQRQKKDNLMHDEESNDKEQENYDKFLDQMNQEWKDSEQEQRQQEPEEQRPDAEEDEDFRAHFDERNIDEEPDGIMKTAAAADADATERSQLRRRLNSFLLCFSGRSYFQILQIVVLVLIMSVITFVTLKFIIHTGEEEVANEYLGEETLQGGAGEILEELNEINNEIPEEQDAVPIATAQHGAVNGDGVSCFSDPQELRQAIDFYLFVYHNQTFASDFDHSVGLKYGKNISNFCFTEKMTDMSFLFDAHRNHLLESFTFPDDLTTWDVSNVQRMEGMFLNAKSFNQPIGKTWNTRNVRNMSYLFHGADSFNQDLSAWDTSSVEDMTAMFKQTKVFDQPINTWNMSNVKTTHSMFTEAESFNQPLDLWDTSNVSDMTYMFAYAQSFNHPSINEWDVSNVQYFTQMFTNAPLFNQPLEKWQPQSAVRMTRMFAGAASFDQNVCVWGSCCLSNHMDMKIQAIFVGTKCPAAKERTKLHITPIGPLCHACA